MKNRSIASKNHLKDIAETLASNEEQIAYVITRALSQVAADVVIEFGSLDRNIDKDLVVGNLRAMADAIENGDLS